MRHFMKNGKVFMEQKPFKADVECDILIVGSGTAGSVAAIRAARLGYSVIAADKQKMPGGAAVFCDIYDYCCGGRSKLSEEINKNAESDDRFVPTKRFDDVQSVNGSARAIEIINCFEKYGVRFLSDSSVFTVGVEKGHIQGVSFITKEGVISIGARLVIDTTGVVARLCGCKTVGGKTMTAAKCYSTIHDGVLVSRQTSVGSLSNDDLMRSYQILNAAAILYKDEPIKSIGANIGERETVRIKTKTVIDSSNIFSKCADAAFIAFAPFRFVGDEIENESLFLQNWLNIAGLKNYGISFAVPKGAMIATNADNLLVAGKVMGMSHDVATALRMKGDMEQSGEAVAMIADEMLDIRAVHTPIEFSGTELFSLIKKDGNYPKIELPDSVDKAMSGLMSDYPEPAFYIVLKDRDKEFIKRLSEMLSANDARIKTRAAVALGMIGDKKAIGILKSVIKGEREEIERQKTEYHDERCDENWCDYDKAKLIVRRAKS